MLLVGCSKTPELKYEGDKEVYVCSKEDVDLLKYDVNVFAKVNQGFLTVDDNGMWNETINHEEDIELEYREKDEDKKIVNSCYFINYDNMKHKYGSTTAISFRDKELGGIRFHVKGEYEYTISNMQKYYDIVLNTKDIETSMETIYRNINTEVVATYILNMSSKTFAEMEQEKVFNDSMLERVNKITKELYGIELKQIDIHAVERVK